VQVSSCFSGRMTHSRTTVNESARASAITASPFNLSTTATALPPPPATTSRYALGALQSTSSVYGFSTPATTCGSVFGTFGVTTPTRIGTITLMNQVSSKMITCIVTTTSGSTSGIRFCRPSVLHNRHLMVSNLEYLQLL
ncbi:hypothetical protein NPIL_576131, partial [Nephila pilipes]